MSFMKKLYGHYQNAPDPPKKSQDNILGLTHLRKLFAEFRHPSKKPSPKEQEDKLYNMIPLFCKVFGEVPSSEMTEKFSDILQFCSHVSKLMVTEIRRRALNQSTDSASFAIVKFLEIESTEESSNGWMLLSALNLLSSGTQALIDCMTATSLPSTLVKCLYLFFDLREIENGDTLEPGCEFTPIERRILLQKVFVQVLVRLCHHTSPAEELARKDDLSLLFSAITSWCLPHNVMWRKSAAEVLMTLSRHGLTNNVTRYIHEMVLQIMLPDINTVSSAEVLMTLSRLGLTNNVSRYIHEMVLQIMLPDISTVSSAEVLMTLARLGLTNNVSRYTCVYTR
ncbi:hypothetical protein KUTeg_004028 [Tegillarca granosa]|uniref:Uncharacterized protein n=1 Tax=Tegillarca granosa TaxID=220873 RepID=A0ABQ9FNT4_TEGGR|nr:hypothetical protein KUTeg_004028 [Tegillarca granosa]